jgi:hypothetical protein
MVWVYYSAQIFLFGAEFTWVYAHELGSRRGAARPQPAAGEPSADAAAPRHQSYPLPAPRFAPPPPPERRSRVSRLRRQHPYAGIGMAFFVGAAAGIAKALGAPSRAARHNPFTNRRSVLSGITRRWT